MSLSTTALDSFVFVCLMFLPSLAASANRTQPVFQAGDGRHRWSEETPRVLRHLVGKKGCGGKGANALCAAGLMLAASWVSSIVTLVAFACLPPALCSLGSAGEKVNVLPVIVAPRT